MDILYPQKVGGVSLAKLLLKFCGTFSLDAFPEDFQRQSVSNLRPFGSYNHSAMETTITRKIEILYIHLLIKPGRISLLKMDQDVGLIEIYIYIYHTFHLDVCFHPFVIYLWIKNFVNVESRIRCTQGSKQKETNKCF